MVESETPTGDAMVHAFNQIMMTNRKADGVTRDYIWPQTMRLPARPPRIVYLDLNHWIALSKAFNGHASGRNHEDALAACLRAAKAGRAEFPISDTIYFEVSKIGPYRQRRDLAKTIERLSGYRVVTARSIISIHELEAVLDVVLGPRRKPVNDMDYLDWGVARAFGKVGGFRVKDSLDNRDMTEEVRSTHTDGPAAFDTLMAQAEWQLNRKMIEGPSPEEEPAMADLGWNPRSAFEVAENRARQEVEQVARFKQHPDFPRSRLRDAVAVRELAIELTDHLNDGVAARGATIEDVTGNEVELRELMESMPSFDVAVSLKTEYHRDPNHRWTTNDVADIDALGSTLPYCDVVVTDKAVKANVEKAGLSDRLDTVVLARLSDLEAYLVNDS